jgi:hypothetical protein
VTFNSIRLATSLFTRQGSHVTDPTRKAPSTLTGCRGIRSSIDNQAEAEDERGGIVPNVVFPTAIEQIEGVRYVFYGMADSKIGVARLDHA